MHHPDDSEVPELLNAALEALEEIERLSGLFELIDLLDEAEPGRAMEMYLEILGDKLHIAKLSIRKTLNYLHHSLEPL